MATAEDLRLFQLHQTQSGMQPPKVVAISKTATRSIATANRLRIRIPRHGIKTTVLLA